MIADPDTILRNVAAAGSSRELAGHLLRVPDVVVLQHGTALQLSCAEKTFAAGVAFLELRAAALASPRDAHGLLPGWIGHELEMWRFVLSRFAAGQGPDALPRFMTEAQ